MLLMSPLSVVKVGPNQIDVKIVELQRCKLQIGERHASAELTGRRKGFHRCCMVLSLTHPPHQHAKDQRSNAMNHRKICQTTIPGLTRRLGLAGNHVIIYVYIYIYTHENIVKGLPDCDASCAVTCMAVRSWGKGSRTKPVVGVAPLVPWGFAATVVVGKQGGWKERGGLAGRCRSHHLRLVAEPAFQHRGPASDVA